LNYFNYNSYEDIFIEDFDILSEKKEIILKELDSIPFYLKPFSSSTKFPYYGHCLVDRPNTNYNLFNENSEIVVKSKYFNYFANIVDDFCCKYNIRIRNIIRAYINSTHYVPKYRYVDPHVDYFNNHLVLLMYLNKTSLSSTTIIFEKTQNFDGKDPVFFDISKLKNNFMKIKKEIIPNFGKIVIFNGKHYHSHRFPKNNKNRIVCVFNLLI